MHSIYNAHSQSAVGSQSVRPTSSLIFVVWLAVLLVFAGCADEPAPVALLEDGATELASFLAVADFGGQPLKYQLGTASARAALGEGWAADEKRGRDGRPFAWGLGEFSTLRFFVNQTIDFELVLEGKTIAFSGAPDQRVTVEINGDKVGEIRVGRRMGKQRLKVPATTLRLGHNEATLRYTYFRPPHEIDTDLPDKRPLAVQWFSITFSGLGGDGQVRAESPVARASSAVAAADEATATDMAERATPQEANKYLVIPRGHRIRVFFDTGERSQLILPWRLGRGEAVPLRLHVGIEADGQALEEHSLPVGEEAGEIRLDLPDETLVRLTLSVTRDPSQASGGWRSWFGEGAPGEVLLPGAQLIGLKAPVTATQAMPEPRVERPNILVYLIDTLRADHLGIYGYERPTSPQIDAFAEDAVVFEDSQAQTSWTRTAVVSLFTGLNPQSHRVNGRLDALPLSFDTMAELLHGAGYQTGAIITNGNIENRFGTGQGFEGYYRLPERRSRATVHELSDRLNERAFHWLDTVRDGERPFFLYLHATDPHAPYTPPEPYKSRFAPDVDPELGKLERVHPIFQGKAPMPEGFREDIIDLYDAEIAFNDHHFGRLLARLKALGLYEDLLIVLLSDHGEEFDDHGAWEHGKTLYSEQLHVPLLIKLPRGEGAGQRVQSMGRQVDVLPTLLDYAGLPLPSVRDGRSLLPAIRGTEPEDLRPVSYSLVSLDRREVEAAAGRGFKLIENRTRDVSTHELYNYLEDSAEQTDLVGEHNFDGDFLHQALRVLRWAQRQRSLARPEQAEVSGELEERLRALGYLN